jgi:hypothetical protein
MPSWSAAFAGVFVGVERSFVVVGGFEMGGWKADATAAAARSARSMDIV